VDSDLLLIRTGFCDKRKERIYWENNPGLNAELGLKLRVNMPNLKAVGFDFISVSRWKDRAEGRRAHRDFLDPQAKGNPILLIEDMDLTNFRVSKKIISSVTVLPLRMLNADGAPVTIIAQ